MLEGLLTIMRRREEDAAAAVGEAQRAVDRQRTACQAKQAALDEHVVRQRVERAHLYEEVYRKNVTRAKLEGYREQIGLLTKRQLQLEEELEEAERNLQAVEADLQGAKRKRLDARKQVVKYEEYQAVLEAKQAQAAQRKEEAETEDIATLRL